MGSMKGGWKIFASVVSAGIVSLLLELSLLREFVYVIGSTAFSNSLVISVFLGGLAVGTYLGIWKRFKSKDERSVRIKFALLQGVQILFVFLFTSTKDYFIYVSLNEPVIVSYFILATFIPSLIAGASYATMVELLYHRGQRYIIHIYAYSTIGNVIGGLLHGYVFMYLFGMHAAYVFAVFCAAVSILLVYPVQKIRVLAVIAAASIIPAGMIAGSVIPSALFPLDSLLYREHSPYGLVEVWRMKDGKHVQMTIDNVHQYYSYDWDNDIHAQWADTTLEMFDRPVRVLVLGYGSGISSSAFLSSPKTRSVDTVENAVPVMTAGKRFFPTEYGKLTADSRSRIIVTDFRKYIRFTDVKYDIILLDHSMIDPYYAGFFTLEFFDQLKRVLTPGGVVASLGVGLSWDTVRASFPYMYTYTGEGRELIRTSGFFLTTEALAGNVSSRFTPESDGPLGEPVYSDHRVFGNSLRTAFGAIRGRVTRTMQ